MKRTALLFIEMVAMVILGGCSRSVDTEMLFVDIDPQRVTPDSVIFKDREIIILETTPKAIMSSVIAIDLYKDNLYILDRRRENILVFNRDGTFISTIGRRGRGPGEYPKITAFCVDRQNDELIVLADWPRKLMFFSLSGEFLSETQTENPVDQIIKSGDNLYCRIISDEKYDFAEYEIENHEIKSVNHPEISKLRSNKEEIMTPGGNMILGSKYGTLFTRVFDNTIYKVTDGELTPLVTLDFGKYQLPDANALSGEVLKQKIYQDRIIYGISNARMMGKDKIVFNGFPNGLFVISNGTAHHYGGIRTDLFIHANKDMTPFLDTETDCVAFTENASRFEIIPRKDTASLDHDRARLARVKPNDNPVIYLYKLK